MVKFYTTNHTYTYPFPAVTLAYFLRYPNPLSTHVLSTDVISRHFDPETQRLYTTRLHLKQSKLPSAILKLLPRGIITGGKGTQGEAQNFILEKSVVDIKEGWMQTETRNLQYTGVLTVVEKQMYSRTGEFNTSTSGDDRTDVQTTVTFLSRFGQQKAIAAAKSEEAPEKKKGFFSTWSTSALQRTIEATGVQRTRNAMIKSKEGMNIVLERMRQGGLVGVLEGMKRDRETYMSGVGTVGIWKKEN